MRVAPERWEVTAQNLPEHAHNAIHTDAGAHAAGFPRALVAGVTTYAYLTHPIVSAWGESWLTGGGGEVWFRSPVFQHDRLVCSPRPDGDAVVVDASCDDGPPRASFRAVADAGPPPATRSGQQLRTRRVQLDGEWSTDYGLRAGDDLLIYFDLGIVHPAVWPALANHVVHAELVTGSWIHTRSIIRHHAIARAGEVAEISATVVRRFHRSGERAVVDVRIEIGGSPVATLEHEAIIALDT